MKELKVYRRLDGRRSTDDSPFGVICPGAAMAANPVAPNPLDTLQQKTKETQKQFKAVANKAGVPEPVRHCAQDS